MAKSGELKEMWDVAAKTNLQFNMVRLIPHGTVSHHIAKLHGTLTSGQRGADVPTVLQVSFITCCVLLTVVALTYAFARLKPVYLLDYHCYKPPDR